jgi:hypothetical protein
LARHRRLRSAQKKELTPIVPRQKKELTPIVPRRLRSAQKKELTPIVPQKKELTPIVRHQLSANCPNWETARVAHDAVS